jgi:MarR family transcriptional regulator, 2-MHQ and catechol-resistance regulon repressor
VLDQLPNLKRLTSFATSTNANPSLIASGCTIDKRCFCSSLAMNFSGMIIAATDKVPTQQSSPMAQSLPVAYMMDPADQPFMHAARALLKAGFLFVNHPGRLYHGYLTVPQVDVLTALADAGGASLSCSEIAERTLLTKDGITGILDRLEAKGLVKRTLSRDDRHSVLVRLSAKGGQLFRKLFPELVRCNRSLFKKALKPEQLKELGGLLEILIRSLEWE